MLFLHWFYKVVREKCWFYIGFPRLSASCPRKMLKNHLFSFVFRPKLRGQPADNQRARFAHHATTPKLASYRPSTVIRMPLARTLISRLASPARTHERNETISRLAVSQRTHPPNIQYIDTHIYIYIYIYRRLEGVSPTGKSFRFVCACERAGERAGGRRARDQIRLPRRIWIE